MLHEFESQQPSASRNEEDEDGHEEGCLSTKLAGAGGYNHEDNDGGNHEAEDEEDKPVDVVCVCAVHGFVMDFA